MAYIDKDGNVCEGKQRGFFDIIKTFFAFILFFFQSLLGLSSAKDRKADSTDYRNIVRGGGGSNGAYRRGGDGMRRDIGRLQDQSGIAPPPMGGGCCGGGSCS